MNALIFVSFILAYFLYFGILSIAFFKAAGKQSWEALVPVYNVYIMTQLIGRPWWWVILTALPVVGNIMIIVIMFEMLHMFRLGTFKNILIATLTAGLYYAYLGYSSNLVYQERDIKIIRKHISELVASIIFAVVAASAIRAYTFEAFTIPTPSMEKSLLVGDFLFVSKFHYGIRLPMTPFALPLVHSHIPGSATINAYTDKLTLPYLRLPAFSDIERNDPIVFNYPAEDIRYKAFGMEGEVRPIDKREHYVKRVVGLPGEDFEIRDTQILIDGEISQTPDRVETQHSYVIYTDPNFGLTEQTLKSVLDVNAIQAIKSEIEKINTKEHGIVLRYVLDIPDGKVNDLLAIQGVVHAEKFIHQPNLANPVYPNPNYHNDDLKYKWSRDNYGPIWIPAKGESIELNEDNYYRYKRVIEAYEGNESFEVENGKFYLNGDEVSSYTFTQDYFFMMGDNRHSSDDSRFWGFVPHDHIVGKPVFVWMSYDKFQSGMDKIRFDRVFTTVNGKGERKSYFWHVAIIVLAFYGFRAYRKREKKEETP